MHEDMPINPLCIIAALGGVVHISTSKKYYLRNGLERFKSVCSYVFVLQLVK